MNAADQLHALTTYVESAEPECAKHPRRARRLTRLMLQIKAANPQYGPDEVVREAKQTYGFGLIGLFAMSLLVSVVARLLCDWIEKHWKGELRPLAEAAACENTMQIDCSDDDE